MGSIQWEKLVVFTKWIESLTRLNVSCVMSLREKRDRGCRGQGGEVEREREREREWGRERKGEGERGERREKERERERE